MFKKSLKFNLGMEKLERKLDFWKIVEKVGIPLLYFTGGAMIGDLLAKDNFVSRTGYTIAELIVGGVALGVGVCLSYKYFNKSNQSTL